MVKKVFVISYDLKNKSANYENLYSAIKEAERWWHYLESFWIIVSEETATQWGEKLREKINADDSLLVLEVDVKSYSGWLPQKAWDWIQSNTMEN